MATIMIGSARIGENGKITGGKDGDQNGKEVSTQKFYVSSKGWNILRAKSATVAASLAKGMQIACDNPNIGYNQNERLDIIKNGVNSKIPINADCSSTVRACCIYAGFDPGNFTTIDEAKKLMNTGLFNQLSYSNGVTLYDGDILVTKTKGHTVIVTSGNPRIQSTSTATISAKPAVAQPTIKKGAKGEEARNLQKDLNYVIKAGLVEDGSFGSKSVEALIQWQAANGLVADGSYGPKSYEKMKLLIK